MPFKIHPAIGVARLGNSTTEWFVGPETVDEPTPPPGGYKDIFCRVKRQAARFRVFEYTESGELVGEVTSADAHIRWHVTLANRKGRPIKPAGKSLDGPGHTVLFDDGAFEVPGVGRAVVPLGEARTEPSGALLILGGFGVADEIGGEWYDDTADGPVTASVARGLIHEKADPAWVIVAPPDFAPCTTPCMSLYDRMLQFYLDRGVQVGLPSTLSFSRHIYPMLRGVLDLTDLTLFAGSGSSQLQLPVPAADRPGLIALFSVVQNAYYNVPENPRLITETQAEWLTRWREHVDVAEDWFTAAPISPEELDRGPLSHCAGFPLAPGWDAGPFLVADPDSYMAPFRFDPHKVAAGDATRGLRAPWQKDLPDCTEYFWPAQRPGVAKVPGEVDKSSWLPTQATDWKELNFVVRDGNELVAALCQGGHDLTNASLAEVVRIIFGVIQDGGGLTDHGPVDPWGPWVEVMAALSIHETARQLRGQEARAIQTAAVTAIAKIGKQQIARLRRENTR